MPQGRRSGWLHIDLIDSTFSAITEPLTPSVLNTTGNYSVGAQKYEQPLSLKPESHEPDLLPINLVISCLLVIVVIVHGVFSQSRKAGLSGIFALACLAMTAIIGPIVGSILLVLACYRQCVLTILKVTSKRGLFAGLMKGNDAFWALEQESSRSVINILALADFSFIVQSSHNNEEPLRTVQELIEDRLLAHPSPFPKLLCYRKHYLGYFYWERQSYIDVADHVRWMEIDEQSYSFNDSGKYFTEPLLKNYVSTMSNSPLPADHLSGWEILIGRYPVSLDCNRTSVDDYENRMFNMMENGGNFESVIKYPVLFRVHHSLGDGVALVRLLLDALADPCTRTPSRTPTPTLEYHNIPSTLINQPRDLNELESVRCESTYLNIPASSYYMDRVNDHEEKLEPIKKSVSLNFDDWTNRPLNECAYNKGLFTPSTSIRDCVRAACRKFINLIEETNQLNRLQYQTQSLQNINIVINDVPTSNEGVYEICDKSLNDVTISTEFNEIYNSNDMCKNIVTRDDRRRFRKLFVNCDGEDNDKNGNKIISMIVNILKDKMKLIKDILYHLMILTLLPATVVNQAITRTFDENSLHGPKLSGYKVVGWYLEKTNDEDKCLMSMIKQIRRRTGAHFSDVVLTALSVSLEEFYGRFHDIPIDVTAIIPARIGRPNRDEEYNAKISTATIKSKELNAKITKLYLDTNAKRNHSVLYETSGTSLDNKFSVALLTIPIARKTSDEDVFTKMKRVQKHTDVLRKSADYLVNFWILNVVATLFPIPLLRNMVQSTQSSLVVSNMPGPQTVARLAGHLLHNIVFWVPNRETTGVGITILSYNGRLQLGIIADRALIPCSEDAQIIIDGIVSTIRKMNEKSSAN